MKEILKNYLIPYLGNRHIPHLLSIKPVLFILGTIFAIEFLFLLSITTFIPSSNFFADILSNVLIDKSNASRVTENITPLTLNFTLEKAAQEKARDMAAKGYFSHYSPDGTSPWEWIRRSGYVFSLAGENLAINFVDSEDVSKAWMDSESHRGNILEEDFTEVGIGTARGIYEGRETIFVVQFLAKPSLKSMPPSNNENKQPLKLEERSPISVINHSEQNSKEAPAVPTAQFSLEFPTYSSLSTRIATKPHSLMTYFYAGLAVVISFILILTVFMGLKGHKFKPIINGAFLLAFIAIFILLNHYIAISNASVL
mgnify:CR=1 FL=1